MAPGVDLIVDVLEGEILPGLGRIVVDLVGNVVGPDGQVMRQEFGKRRKDVKRLDAFKAVVRKVLGLELTVNSPSSNRGGRRPLKSRPEGARADGGRLPDYVLSVSGTGSVLLAQIINGKTSPCICGQGHPCG